MSLAAVTRQVAKRRIVQGVFIVSAALAVEYGAQLARSLVLTRSLSPTEFGIASSMAILASLVDMSTGLGADRYLVQAKDGGGREALAVAHALTVGKSALSACLLLALAWPTAALLGVPQATGAFLWLASIPMVRGFEHLRVEQVQRENRFWPSACAAIAANVAGLVAVAWAAFALRDHRAVLWGLGAQAAALVVTSRLLARTPYRLSVSSAAVRPALRFGLPLMVNGLALAALGQFDRLAVGGLLGVAELGRYSLATMIFYLPTSLLFRVVTSIAQPRLAAAWHASPLFRFPDLFSRMNAAAAAGAALAAAGAAMFGDAVLTAVFGPAFGVGDPFFAVFGLAVFMRFAKQSANIAGLAIGRTKDLMLSNLPGALGLAATVGAVLVVPSLAVAAAGVLVGEALGAATAFLRLDRDLRAAGPPSYAPFAFALPIPCAAGAWVLLDDPSLPLRAAVFGALCLGVAAAAWLAFRRRAIQAAG
jgi:O-antigen/teichoic acid export membrane protein